MISKKNSLAIFFLLSCLSEAQQNRSTLKSNEVFLTEPSRMVNSLSYQTNQEIRKGLKGESFKIAKDWRLVSVTQVNSKTHSESEFILFFQDAKSAVHTVGIQSNGMLSGNNLFFIPASE